jgi:hypothetical protein
MLFWMYLEQVIPTTYGISKHPLFFLGFGKNKEKELDALRNDNEGVDLPK